MTQHPKDREIKRALLFQNTSIEVSGLEFDWLTGDGNSANPLTGAPSGYMFVHRQDLRSAAIAVLIGDRMMPIRRIAGRRCMVGYNAAGERIAYAPMVDGISAVASTTSWRADTSLAWTASVSNPSIGNGILDSIYRIDGNLMTVRIAVVAGSTTTFGSGTWYFSMPVTPTVIVFSTGYATDSNTGISYLVSNTYGGGVVNAFTHNTAPFSSTVPFTWAQNDILIFSVMVSI